MADLTTRTKVRLALKLPAQDVGSDALLDQLIPEVSALVRKLTRRSLTTVSVDRVFDGPGRSYLDLRDYPVQSMTALYESMDQTWNSGTQIAASSFLLDKRLGYVFRIGGAEFQRWPQSVRCVFDAGYANLATEAPELELLANRLVVRAFMQSDVDVSAVAQSLKDGSTSYAVERLLTPDDYKVIRAHFNPRG